MRDGYKPRTFEQLIIQVQNVLYVGANPSDALVKKQVQNVSIFPIVQNLCFVCVWLCVKTHCFANMCTLIGILGKDVYLLGILQPVFVWHSGSDAVLGCVSWRCSSTEINGSTWTFINGRQIYSILFFWDGLFSGASCQFLGVYRFFVDPHLQWHRHKHPVLRMKR